MILKSGKNTVVKIIASGLLGIAGVLVGIGDSSLSLVYASEVGDVASTQVALEKVTVELLQMNAEVLQGRALVSDLEKLSLRRKKLILQALSKNPGLVLKVALSHEIRSSLHEKARVNIEATVTQLEGVLSTKMIMPDMMMNPTVEYVLQQDSGKEFQVYFNNTPASVPHTGSRILIPAGVEIATVDGKDALLVPNEPSQAGFIVTHEVRAEAAGVMTTAFFLLNFSDAPNNKPWTVAYGLDMFGNLNNFFKQNSFGKFSIAGDVLGYYTINVPDHCEIGAIQNAAQAAAAAAGVDVSKYWDRVFIYPASCSYVALGYVGGGASFIANSAWVNVIGHEMGHNIGLWHANGLFCGGASPIGNNCTNDEYADPADIMGSAGMFYFNAFHKEQLGWLNASDSPPMTTLTSGQRLVLEPYRLDTKNPKAVKILKSNNADGTQNYYYLEYRQPSEYDNGMSPDLFKGILIHQGNNRISNSSHLLDMTPADHNYRNGALLPGNSFKDPDAPNGGVTITVNSVSAAGADITVAFGLDKPVCSPVKPTLSIAPNQIQWVKAGVSANYEVTLVNNDNSECKPSVFQFSAMNSAHLNSSFSASSLTVAPGATGKITLQLATDNNAGTWIHRSLVSAVNSTNASILGAVEASLGVVPTVCVAKNPAVTLMPSLLKARAGDTLIYTASIKNLDDYTNCNQSVYGLSAKGPSGFKYSLSSTSIRSVPGSTRNIAIEVTSPKTFAPANYAFNVVAKNSMNSAISGEGAGTTVIDPAANSLKGTIQLDRPDYTRDPNVTVNATITFTSLFRATPASVPAPGTDVSIRITSPDGSVMSQEGKTNASGNLVYIYPIKSNARVGKYRIAMTLLNSNLKASATGSFTLQ